MGIDATGCAKESDSGPADAATPAVDSCAMAGGSSGCDDAAGPAPNTTCSDQCEAAAWSCSSESTRIQCVQVDGCWKRVHEVCEDGRCAQGTCLPPCVHGCTALDEIACDGDALKTCTTDETGCRKWGNFEPCAAGTRCQDGHCLICSDECETPGSRTCADDTVIECVNIDDEPCLEAKAIQSCDPGRRCQEGECVNDCVHDCEPHGATRCSGGLESTCGDHDGDGCRDWGKPVQCEQNQLCFGGSCACLDACKSPYVLGCFGDQLAYCLEGADGCLMVTWMESCEEEGEVCFGGKCTIGPFVVISEVARLGPDSLIELHGPPGLNLLGWSISIESSLPFLQMPLKGPIEPNGYWVITNGYFPDDVANFNIPVFKVPESARIVLWQGKRVVDVVSFGDSAGGGALAGEGSSAPTLPLNMVLARNEAGRDTQNNIADFRVFDVPTLGLPNVAPNTPPVPVLSCPVGGILGEPTPIDMSGSSDFEDVITTWSISFGDGTTATTPVESHTFASTGAYGITLVAGDAQGLTEETSCTVTVEESSPPTLMWLTPPKGTTLTVGAWVEASVDAVAAPGRKVVGVTLFMDGLAVGPAVTAPPYSRLMKTPKGVASVVLTAHAVDDYGEERVSEPLVVNLDETPP